MTLLVHDVCSNCGNQSVVPDGEEVCAKCGTILGPLYEYSSHAMVEGSYEGPTQYTSVGKRINVVGELGSEIGLFRSTLVGIRYRITEEAAEKFNRLNYIHHRQAKTASVQTHLRTFSIFNRVASQLQLTNSLRNRTAHLYWKYDSEHRITNHVLLIAMCLLYAVRESGSPLKFQEIIAAFESHRVIPRAINKLARDLGVNFARLGVRKPEDYVGRIAEQVSNHEAVKLDDYGMSRGTYQALLTKISEYFLSTIGRRERGGVQPHGYAVAVVYLADRGIARYFRRVPVLTQPLVAEITGAREYTIRDHVSMTLNWKTWVRGRIMPYVKQIMEGSS